MTTKLIPTAGRDTAARILRMQRRNAYRRARKTCMDRAEARAFVIEYVF